jgi:hypothetical protein
VIYTPLHLFQIQPRTANFELIGTDRAPGLHLSHIIKRMKEEAGEKVTGVEGEQEWLRAQIGFLWEIALEIAWKRYVQVCDFQQLPFHRGVKDSQLTLQLDGIHMTPDALDIEEEALEESKLTWRSMRKWVEDPVNNFAFWHVQTMGYLKGINELRKQARMPPILKVRYFVFWCGGDYSHKPGRGPQPTAGEMRVAEEEIEQNWRTILRYKAVLEKEAA